MPSRFAQFKLCAHFLEAGSKSVNLFLELLDFAVLFEKLVEKHRVHCVLANAVDLAILVANYEVWIDCSDLFGQQPKLRCFGLVALVLKLLGDRRFFIDKRLGAARVPQPCGCYCCYFREPRQRLVRTMELKA